MEHKLDYRIAGAINGAVGNYLHRNAPIGATTNIGVHVSFDREALKKKIDAMTEEGEDVIIRAINSLETVPSS